VGSVEPEVVEARPIGVRHIYTSWIADRLKKAIDEGHEVVTWEDLSQVLGERAQDHRSKIDTARKLILREHRVRFQSVPGVGYRRANDQEVLGEVTVRRRSISRRSAAALEILGLGSDLTKLTQEDRTRYVVEQSILALTHKSASDKSHQAITGKIKPAAARLSLEETFLALKK